ncbi:hypothetical protein J2S04_000575 [Alicyclobacillus tengchongensis]|uniref:Uncharacterized protein n=3 Tax=Alicyclobacillus tolerans TaxID=90970 RepID=A0ABT9LTQ9_9BACL|nr:hypothetical protein [Alicyclobacillus tengchongensis]
MMQFIPKALGQSNDLLTFWDHLPEMAILLPRPLQVVSEIQWGIGELDRQPCLILYLFVGEDTLELLLPRELPTSPHEQVDVWELLISWRTDCVKLRYGESPLHAEQEVTLFLPASESEALLSQLYLFVQKSLTLSSTKELPQSHQDCLIALKERIEEHREQSRESV